MTASPVKLFGIYSQHLTYVVPASPVNHYIDTSKDVLSFIKKLGYFC